MALNADTQNAIQNAIQNILASRNNNNNNNNNNNPNINNNNNNGNNGTNGIHNQNLFNSLYNGNVSGVVTPNLNNKTYVVYYHLSINSINHYTQKILKINQTQQFLRIFSFLLLSNRLNIDDIIYD